MTTMFIEKRLLMLAYGLNAIISIILPLIALVALHFYPYALTTFLTNLFGFLILFAVAISMFLKNRFLYVLNVFSSVIFMNAFIKSSFPASFIHVDFVIYALLIVAFVCIDSGRLFSIKNGRESCRGY